MSIRHNIVPASSATAVYHCTQESLKTTAFEFFFNVPLYQMNVADKTKFLWTKSVFRLLGEQPTAAQSTQAEVPPTEGVGSESAAAPPETVPAPSEAPSEAGVKSESKSEKGTSKSKGDSKPGIDDE